VVFGGFWLWITGLLERVGQSRQVGACFEGFSVTHSKQCLYGRITALNCRDNRDSGQYKSEWFVDQKRLKKVQFGLYILIFDLILIIGEFSD
jgi:hypothetical protein